jgi:hypothetical protein
MLGVGPCTLDHGRVEVEAGHVEAEPAGQEGGQATGAAPDL